jgi:hypothetical protein
VTARHPATSTWTFPPERAPDPDRLNLKELAARPERFEHHLIVVAKLGCAQLEIATASEPLYFAHVNISDEYAVALPTGDPLLDAFPLRTFVSDRTTGADVGRYNHRAGDLVLHPHGFAHWPGKLRPPYAGFDIPPGMRRCGVSLVYCASVPTRSTATVISLPPGRKPDDVKPYVDPPPTLSLAALAGPPGVIARVGNTQLELVERPAQIAPPRGGWVVVVSGLAAGPHAAFDLIRVAPGTALEGAGIDRALVLSGNAGPEAIPPSWSALPPAPFPVFEDKPPGTLPLVVGGHRRKVNPGVAGVPGVGDPPGPSLRVEERSASIVAVTLEDVTALVPRYWLARMLFRIALHDVRLNYVETYEGVFVDDAGSDVEIGIRTGDRRVSLAIPRADALGVIERLYRGVAPADYRERLS